MAPSANIIFRYFDNLSPKQIDQFEQLGNLYRFWNKQINVVSRKDIDHIYEHHVLHSLAIAKSFPFTEKSIIADIGTGGGFPGLPLAILSPDVEFHLIDSIGKKIKVVKQVSQSIDLSNIYPIHSRAEDLNQKFDIILTRALTTLKSTFELCKGILEEDRTDPSAPVVICLKGGDLRHEILELNMKTSKVEINGYFNEAYFDDKYVIGIYNSSTQ